MIFSPGTLPWQTGQPALVEGSTYRGTPEQPDQHDLRVVVVVVVVVVDNQRGPRVVVVVVDIASLSRDLWAEVVGLPPRIIYLIIIVVITITITVINIIINLGLPSKIKSLLGVHKTTMAGSRSGQKRQFKKIVNATTKFALTAPLTLFGTRVDIWMRKNLASCINFSEKYVKRRFKQFHGKLSISISFNQVGLKGLLRIYLRTV